MAQSISRHKNTRSRRGSKVASKNRAQIRNSKDRFKKLGLTVTPILKPYVKRISVFGSYARGEETRESDIDLLIALKPAETRPVLGLLGFIKLEQELGKKLGREVDLITEEGLNPRRRSNIERDRVILYEAK
jgi:predicted nucleotidyltransferase